MKKNFLYDKVVIEFNKKSDLKNNYNSYMNLFNFQPFHTVVNKSKIKYYYSYKI